MDDHRSSHTRERKRQAREQRRQEREQRREARNARRAARRSGDERPVRAPEPEAVAAQQELDALERGPGRVERAESEAPPPVEEPVRRERDEELEEAALDDDRHETEEEVLREARRIARAKARVAREVVEWGVVVGVLSLVLPIAAWIVGIIWGLEIAGKFAKKVLEPSLRRRWIDREVHRRLRHTVPVQRQKLEGEHSRRIEELAAGVAHEIRNPITAARSLVQQMGEDPGARENVDYAKVALDELQRVEKSVAHLLRFAREEEFHSDSVSLEDVIESAIETMQERAGQVGARIETDIDQVEAVLGDGEQLRRVMLNLLSNALDALHEAGVESPRIQVQAGQNLAGTEVWVRVRDNGPGIEPERLARVFSPFYTSKETGTGLGLAISKKVIDAHGGSIEAASEPGRGTEFVITLPRSGQISSRGEA
ncbi:MAG: ATP-binding protein [Myxococcota bacterium]|nr:ATP-binding protein [Myxococcota bacterium]